MNGNASSLPQVLLTLNEAARCLSVCRRTLEREIAAGRFPRPLKIGRAIRISQDDLLAYLDRLRADNPGAMTG